MGKITWGPCRHSVLDVYW